MDSYVILIGISLLVILSYIFNILSQRLKIPTVILLILSGLLIKYTAQSFGFEFDNLLTILELFGIVGLIIIVLEGALDLKITKEKSALIRSSFLSGVLLLVFTTVGISYLLFTFFETSFFNAMVTAVSLSVISSAIVISSVNSINNENKKEFLVYESTFSDIIGIMIFNFMVLEYGSTGQEVTLNITGTVIITILVSLVISYILVYFFHNVKTNIKLFLLMAVLTLLYSLGKYLHLSSLLIILVFGLVLNNTKLFFPGKLNTLLLKDESIEGFLKEVKVIVAESAFLIRTFFFIIFGMSIDLTQLLKVDVWVIGFLILVIIYTLRFIVLKWTIKDSIRPELYMAPRGLITILLFYAIPQGFRIEGFNEGILVFLVLASSIIMMLELMMPADRMSVTKLQKDGIIPFSKYIKE